MTIKLIKWISEENQFIKEPAEKNVIAIAFDVGPNKIIEVGRDGDSGGRLVIRSVHGRLKITMDVANQFSVEVE